MRWVRPYWCWERCAYLVHDSKESDLVNGYIYEGPPIPPITAEKTWKILTEVQYILDRGKHYMFDPYRYYLYDNNIHPTDWLKRVRAEDPERYERIRKAQHNPRNLKPPIKDHNPEQAMMWAPWFIVKDKPHSGMLAPLLVTPVTDTRITNESLFFSLAALCYLPRVYNTYHIYLLIKSFLRNVIRAVNTTIDLDRICRIRFRHMIYPIDVKSDPEILTNPLLHYMLYLINGREHANLLRDTTAAMYVKTSSNPELRERMSEVLTLFSAAVDPIVKKTPELKDRVPARIVFLPLMKTRKLPSPAEIEEVNRFYEGTPLENVLKVSISRFLGCPML